MSAAQAYQPRVGSIGDRAIALLRARGEMAVGPLASELDCDAESVRLALQYAVTLGAVVKERRDGLNRYRLGDGAPLPRDAEDGPLHATTPPAAPGSVPSNIFDLAKHMPAEETEPAAPASAANGKSADEPAQEAAGLHVVPPPAAAKMRIALWSDGCLVVERGGECIEFSKAEARQLVAYLDAISLDSLRGESAA